MKKSIIIFCLLIINSISLFSQVIPEYLVQEAYNRSLFDVRASHILIKLDKNASPEDTLANYNKIIAIRNRLIKGEDFAKVAIEVSQDPTVRDREDAGSKSIINGNGGDLGYFTVFDMVYPFETAAYTSKVGSISMPVRTDFGYHIIKVTDRKPAMGKVTVAHIFVSIPKAAKPEDLAKYKAKIEEAYTKIKEGAKFEDIVNEYSDDKATAAKGGALPAFGVNRMVPDFIIAISKLNNIGEISQPTQTIYGWHIIKLIEKKPIGTYEEDRQKLTEKITKDSRFINNCKAIFLTIAEEKITVGEVISVYKKNNPNEVKLDKEKINEYLELFVNFKLKVIDAQYNGLDTTAAFKKELEEYDVKNKRDPALKKEYHDGILLFNWTDKNVWSKAANDINGRKKFYENNKSKYSPKSYLEAEKQITADYQNLLEKDWVIQLKEKYTIKIDKDILWNEIAKTNRPIDKQNNKSTDDDKTVPNNVIVEPPILIISAISFIDKDNNRIDGNEECNISFAISNKGKGAAKNLKVLVQNTSSVTGLSFSKSTTIGTIGPNATQKIIIPINGTVNLTSGKANIIISFEEEMGFPPDPFELNIETKEFIKPDVKVVDNSFLTDNGSIKLGFPIQLKVLVQNVGQGTAENVNVSFSYPNTTVFPTSQKDFVLGSMLAGASKEIVFEFIANKLYSEKTIPVTINISEKYGKFSQNKQVSAEIDAKSAGNAITITSNATDKTVNIEVASLTSDVDKNIPQNPTKYPNRYALIIGNEDYSSQQTGLSSEVNVAYAINDAKSFKDYVTSVFGIEEKNCFLLLNATSGVMSQKIELVSQILSKLGINGELVFYYAGHGFPDENTKITYLIPVDVNANNLQSAIKLTDIYNKFSQTKAKRITVFLDACFTGGGRDQGLLSARSVKIKPKQETISGNMVVFTATSEDQSALPYKEKQHGIFTYYLLKKLQESKGDITYSELEKYINENVSIESLKINGKAQDPQVNTSTDAQDIWQTWKIKN
jgi:peptidyl-prolyl cis-trans isomerase SurA